MKLTLLIAFLFLYTESTFSQNISGNSVTNSETVKKLVGVGTELWKQDKLDSSLLIFDTALAKAKAINDSLLIAKCINNIGLIYYSKGEPLKSFFYYEEALAFLNSQKYPKEVATMWLNIGIAYKEQAIYDKALNFLFKAAAYFEKGNDTVKLASAYNTIGNIFMLEGNYDKALQYHRLALKQRELLGYKEGIAGSLNNIGIVYKKVTNLDSALYYFNNSLKIATIIRPQSEHVANTLSHIGELYLSRQSFTLARQYYESAFKIREALSTKKGIANSYYEFGQLNIAMVRTSKAEKFFLSAIQISQEVNASDILLKSYEQLRKIYRSLSNYPKALHYDDLYIELKNKILGEETKRTITQMQIKYETEKKQNEILQLNQEKEKQAILLKINHLELNEQKRQLIALIILSIVLGAFLILFYLRYKDKNRFAESIDSLMRELHHRVKNNLQMLSSLLSLQLEDVQDAKAKQILHDDISRITAMNLIHQKLYFDKDVTKVDMLEYIQDLVENLRMTFKGNLKNIRINLEIDNNIMINPDKAIVLGMIINELITNSLKYAFNVGNTNPELEIKLKKAYDKNILQIGDNGSNIGNTQKKSFGLKLVDSYIKSLKAVSEVQYKDGTRHKIIF